MGNIKNNNNNSTLDTSQLDVKTCPEFVICLYHVGSGTL